VLPSRLTTWMLGRGIFVDLGAVWIKAPEILFSANHKSFVIARDENGNEHHYEPEKNRDDT